VVRLAFASASPNDRARSTPAVRRANSDVNATFRQRQPSSDDATFSRAYAHRLAPRTSAVSLDRRAFRRHGQMWAL
jgi:hypothetical protein